MKILFCTNVFEVVENGPVKFANLLLQINERYPEHELHILTEDIAESRSFVHKVPLSHFWKSSPFSQFARMWAYHQAAMRVRKNFAFDVLVYNNALVGLWSSYRFGSTVGMINDDNNLSASWKQARSTSSGYKHIVFKGVEGLMARKASSILVNSEYMRKSVARAYQVPAQKIHLLYKAVEIPAVLPASLPLDPAAPIQVLFVKSDYRRGGLFTLVEALSQLPYHFVLTIVGPNPVDREKIIAQAGHYSNLEYVFLGKVPQQNITRLLSNTHVFCVPSHKEALGVANMEAMAQGVPVISTAVGGIPEVLDHGRCGWMVPPQDVPALAQAIEACISQPALKAAKVAYAYDYVHRFSVPTMFDHFLKILAQ